MTLAPVLTQLHTPILLLAIGQVISGLILVIRPAWIAPRAVAEIVLSIAGIALAWVLWRQMPLVTFTGPVDVIDGVVTLQVMVDNIFKGSALVAVAICTGKILIEGWRLARLGRRRSSSALPGPVCERGVGKSGAGGYFFGLAAVLTTAPGAGADHRADRAGHHRSGGGAGRRALLHVVAAGGQEQGG